MSRLRLRRARQLRLPLALPDPPAEHRPAWWRCAKCQRVNGDGLACRHCGKRRPTRGPTPLIDDPIPF